MLCRLSDNTSYPGKISAVPAALAAEHDFLLKIYYRLPETEPDLFITGIIYRYLVPLLPGV